jgi:uncharacterized protein YndB with AHSA1/START domain
MSTFATELFRFVTCAAEEDVWDALTATGQPLAYFYGMTLTSDWRPGSNLTLTAHPDHRLEGIVLAAQRPGRLSYTVGAGSDEAPTYLTWEMRRCHAGTVVRLYLDEPGSPACTTDELEEVWLPVLSGLAAHLAGRHLAETDPVERPVPLPPGPKDSTNA